MEPGRELDALVAEKVMGGPEACWFRCPRCGGSEFGSNGITRKRHCHAHGCGWVGSAAQAPPAFSTSIAAAWEVVEAMAAKSFHPMSGSWNLASQIVDSSGYGGEDAAWLAFDKLLSLPSHKAAHAICLAALKAVGALP